MPEIKARSYCPMANFDICQRALCAWWVPTLTSCAAPVIAARTHDIADALESIAHCAKVVAGQLNKEI